MTNNAQFITFEGGDCSGKSTMISYACAYLQSQGIDVVVTREPGGTPFGEKIREVLLYGEYDPSSMTELLLFYAARREHLDKTILPAIESGKWVLCDRFEDSTLAYQSSGSGVSLTAVNAISRAVLSGFQPDATIVLDVSAEIALERSRHRSGTQNTDRFEVEGGEFKERVRAYFRDLQSSSDRQIFHIDANQDLVAVQNDIELALVSMVENGT